MKTTGFISSRLMLAVLALIVLQACAGGELLQSTTEQAPADFAALLPQIPQDTAADRNPSGLTQSVQQGIDVWNGSFGIAVDGTHLIIAAQGGQTEWAMYRHQIGYETPLDELQYDISVPQGEQAWVAVANYSRQLWDFSGPVSGSGVVTVNAVDHLSPGAQNVYIVFLAHDGTTIDVGSTTLVYENGVTPSATYQTDMAPIFTNNCMPCHNGTNAQNGIILDSYWRAHENGDAALAKALSDHAPSGMAMITQEEKDQFQSWIDNAKLYGSDITYTANIVPLTQNRCSPCHISGSSGGVNFTTYAGAFAKGEAAWNRIRTNSMPQGGPPLPDSEKDIWFAWVGQGKPE